MVALGVRGNNMALLTEEQIQDLYLQLDKVSSTSAMQKVIQEWNEKQTAQQIEIDWNDAPKNATKAALRLHWVTEDKDLGVERWSASFDSVTFERPAPVITPHPHAALMMKYAEVAARRSDPWVEFEHCCDDIDEDYWIQCDAFIGFHSDYFYRHISYRHIGDKK